MIERYSYEEPLFKLDDEISKGLSLKKNTSAALRIFRLLTGSCTIVDIFFNKKFKTNINYTKFPYEINKSFTKRSMLESFTEDVSLENLSKYFRTLKNNEEFYCAIEFELLNCITSRKSGRYLEAFLFLYRVIEGISFSIPLIHVSTSKNFNKSFRSLQKYMPSKNNEGELLFFKNFIREQWSNENFFKLTIDINIGEIEVEEMRSIYFKLYKEKAGKGISSETEDEELKLTFYGYLEFMIEIRNRYFHFLQGGWQENISSSQIIFPDLFFKPLIDHGINWIGIALLEIIKFDVENHELK